MSAARLGLCATLAAALCACQTTREQETAIKPEVARSYLADKPESLQKHFYVALTQGQRNQVLNDMRLGLASMEMGNTALAEQLLDDALGRIESIYANTEEAAQARQLFTKEAVKDFKGEPYERSMAYYYRGLLYMRAGDYDNARASFLAGFNQDSFAEEEQFQADFGLLQYLQGWASRCRGNTTTADEDFKAFHAIRDTFPLPKPGDNTLILVETGTAPVKFSTGDSASDKPKYLRIRRSSATETAQVSLPAMPPPPPAAPEKPPAKGDKKAASAAPAPAPAPAAVSGGAQQVPLLEDVYFQASTRGGREFDSLLAGKVQFKAATDTVGNAALLGAMVAANVAVSSNNSRTQRDGAAAAGALLLIGLLAKAASEAAEADADTRYWDNLPDRVYAMSAQVPPNANRLTVDFLTPSGEVVRSRDADITRSGACGLAWVRGISAIPGNPRAPSSAPLETMRNPVILPPAETAAAAPPKPDQPNADAKGQ